MIRTLLTALVATMAGAGAFAFEPLVNGPLSATFGIETRASLQTAGGVNFGAGASGAPGDRERTVMSASIEPRLGIDYTAGAHTLYAAGSLIAAGTFFDGEIGGAFGRSGDREADSNEAHLGWRNGMFDVSYGAQDFIVGDGLLIGDGNFDTGSDDGQYWLVPYTAWRNAGIVKLDTEHIDGQAFWLRSDRDFGASRVAGVNLDSAFGAEFGTLGFMFFEVLQANRLNYDGMQVWNVRAADVRHPLVENFSLYGEYILQRGTDDDGGGQANDANGWYIESRYAFARLPWTPAINLRYMHLSGDEPDTPENEEYRGMFYTSGTRGWDTWYQGEIAGQYHLFNQNQVTTMVKLSAAPAPRWLLTLYWYRFDLEEPQYFGAPVSSRAWSDEINLLAEYFSDDGFYAYAAILWSRPRSAARELFGGDDFTVFQTFVMYEF